MDIRLYKKVLAGLTSGVIAFSCCGCSSNDQSVSENDSNKENTSLSSYTTDITSIDSMGYISEITDVLISTTNKTDISVTTSQTTATQTTILENLDSSSFSHDDVTVLDYFTNMGNSIKESLDSSDLLEKGKSYFIYCVDFLFYDGEINGIKFSDMTDLAKQQLLSDITFIDNLICSKFPNYKETISDGTSAAYNKASEIISIGSKNIKDFSKEKLGLENYNKIGEYEDMFMEQASSDFSEFLGILDEGKKKVKSWYEGLK